MPAACFGIWRRWSNDTRNCWRSTPSSDRSILQTPKGPVEIRVTEKRLSLSPTPLPGRPYTEVQQTPQVRIYVLRKTIQGLEAALCGEAGAIEVDRPVHRNRAEANLIRHLQEVQCGNLVVLVRRSRKNLFVCGPAREILYLPAKVRVTDQGTLLTKRPSKSPPVTRAWNTGRCRPRSSNS